MNGNNHNDSHPRRSPSAASLTRAPGGVGTATAAKPGVLVVDDDASIGSMLALGLRMHGFTVWSAHSGEQAIALYREHRDAIAVVLLDIQMPQCDGPQTLAALRELNPSVCCCMMSGNAGDYTGAQLKDQGVAGIIEKPFGPAQLVQVLRQFLS